MHEAGTSWRPPAWSGGRDWSEFVLGCTPGLVGGGSFVEAEPDHYRNDDGCGTDDERDEQAEQRRHRWVCACSGDDHRGCDGAVQAIGCPVATFAAND